MTLRSTDFPAGVASGVACAATMASGAHDALTNVPLDSEVKNPHKGGHGSPCGVAGARPTPPQLPLPRAQTSLVTNVHSPESASTVVLAGIRTTHTVYAVDTRSTLQSPAYARPEQVKRRFSDFVALHEALHRQFAGYFIPRLPDKDIVQGKLLAGRRFLETRVRDLDIFLQACCDHPTLRQSQVLAIFLTLDTECLLSHVDWRAVTEEDPIIGSFKLLPARVPQTKAASAAAQPAGTLNHLRSRLFNYLGRYTVGPAPPPAGNSSPSGLELVRLAAHAAKAHERAQVHSQLCLRLAECVHVQDSLGSVCLALYGALQSLYTRACAGGAAAAAAEPAVAAYADAWSSHVECHAAAQVFHFVGDVCASHGRAAEVAAYPLKQTESALHAAHGGLMDRHELLEAMQALRQTEREALERGTSPSLESSAASRLGGEKVAAALDERLRVMALDYDNVCSLFSKENKSVEATANVNVPVAVHNFGLVQESLTSACAVQWQWLADSL